MKELIKKIYYSLFPQSYPEGTRIRLGYIFHTEALYEKKPFDDMLGFLSSYRKLTGKKALATLMSGANPRVSDGIREHSTKKEFLDRLHAISEEADTGFHGHYVFDNERYKEREFQMRGSRYDMALIEKGMDEELSWFGDNGMKIGPYYSSGWWFHAKEMPALLAKKGFKLDASVSYAPAFRQSFSYSFFRDHGVAAGEPALVSSSQGEVLYVQNLIGCHNTPFPEDFVRHTASLLRGSALKEIYAFVHSHDYDLNPEFALRTIEFLMKKSVEFVSSEELLALKEKARRIRIDA